MSNNNNHPIQLDHIPVALRVTNITYNNQAYVCLKDHYGERYIISRNRYLDHETACKLQYGWKFDHEKFWRAYFTNATPGVRTLEDAQKLGTLQEDSRPSKKGAVRSRKRPLTILSVIFAILTLFIFHSSTLFLAVSIILLLINILYSLVRKIVRH